MPLTSRPSIDGWLSVELLDQRRIARSATLHLEVVVGEMPVLVAAAGQLGLGVRRRELRVGGLVGLRARLEVGDADGVGEVGVTELALVGGAVQDDLDGVRVAVLGQVEAEGLQALCSLRARRRRRSAPCRWSVGDRDEADRQIGARRAAPEAAGLDAQLRPSTKPSASSLEPKPAEPATTGPSFASKTPRSQSPWPDRRARISPVSGAVV